MLAMHTKDSFITLDAHLLSSCPPHFRCLSLSLHLSLSRSAPSLSRSLFPSLFLLVAPSRMKPTISNQRSPHTHWTYKTKNQTSTLPSLLGTLQIIWNQARKNITRLIDNHYFTSSHHIQIDVSVICYQCIEQYWIPCVRTAMLDSLCSDASVSLNTMMFVLHGPASTLLHLPFRGGWLFGSRSGLVPAGFDMVVQLTWMMKKLQIPDLNLTYGFEVNEGFYNEISVWLLCTLHMPGTERVTRNEKRDDPCHIL